jgi:hypothetical protein
VLPLLSVPPNECTSIGGVSALRVWPVDNVYAYPAYTGANITTPLSLVDPLNYADIYFLDQTAGFEEPQGEDAAQGTFYSPKLQVYVNKDAPDVAEAIARLTGGKYLAAYRDANGLTKLVGTPECPLRFSADLETGKKVADRNGYPLTFLGKGRERSPFYLAVETGPIPTRRAFSAGFNFGFS